VLLECTAHDVGLHTRINFDSSGTIRRRRRGAPLPLHLSPLHAGPRSLITGSMIRWSRPRRIIPPPIPPPPTPSIARSGRTSLVVPPLHIISMPPSIIREVLIEFIIVAVVEVVVRGHRARARARAPSIAAVVTAMRIGHGDRRFLCASELRAYGRLRIINHRRF
jgi:hypothetical protein